MKRRHFIAALGAMLGLDACANQNSTGGTPPTPSVVLQTVTNDVGLVANGLLQALPALTGLTGLSAGSVAQITSAIGNLQAELSALTNAQTNAQAQPVVIQIENDVNAVVNAVPAPLMRTLPPPVQLAIKAAQVLLPVIETAVNLVVPASVTRRAEANRMTPDVARAALRSLINSR